ncbi:MAG: GtrA family protein [Helicobacter sp.]|uniref:GtrA family protein n=1 Tax=Helicobacter sp. 10-6591 TaxID=2004998 RepID=UPI000DCC9FCF|nr:GtrA family protein [Helicobacter sp. 10-6591]MCI6217127.1 GtrA family protein [Helicobacter sp.]MCI7484730.1 GtrA family protein [Helicobacter sp.]MDD7567186.1 GtrA family protein [Helicobacter sp.]MDY5740661.1 GtrA family protein [Helicobacter sp.]RAX56283.1 hypothetical protein CCY97_00300 [Helicobacter sp. 10-6591]
MKTYKQLALFFLIGGGLSLAEWIGFYYLCVMGMHYILASLVMFVFISACGILAYRRFVFTTSHKSALFQTFASYAINTIGMGINTLILWILVEFGGMDILLSKILASFVVAFYGFFARKTFIYKE